MLFLRFRMSAHTLTCITSSIDIFIGLERDGFWLTTSWENFCWQHRFSTPASPFVAFALSFSYLAVPTATDYRISKSTTFLITGKEPQLVFRKSAALLI